MKKLKIIALVAILSASSYAAFATECLVCYNHPNEGKCYDSKCSKTNESGTACCGNTISAEEEVNP